MIHPVDAGISQRFGANPTRHLPWDSWLIQTFGNYQPDGHSGIDYACAVGSPVRAVTSGTVLHIGWMGGTYADNPWWVAPGFAGYCAVIDHGSFIGIYGHCQDGSARVGKGARVDEGQVFILSGNTGGSTGPHLHFEILPDRYVLQSAFYGRVNPEPLFNSIASMSVSTQGTTTSKEEDEDMPLSDDDLRKVYQAVWYGAPGAQLIPNEAAGNAEWPYTTLGSLTARISRDIVRPQLAELKGGGAQSTISPAEVADAVIAELGKDLAQIVVDEIGKRIAK